MSKQRKTVASTYLYDPLDRLAASNSIQRFYNDTRIATEIEGERKSRFFETDSHPLALQQHGSLPGTTLLATDQQTSVLNGVSPEGALHAQAYSPFGHHPIGASLNGAGFNGERPEPLTGHYLLGQGYRAFNPILMRFNSPDSWSPFGDGGINAYAYCAGDPVNRTDPTGHSWKSLFKGIGNKFGRTPSRAIVAMDSPHPDFFLKITRKHIYKYDYDIKAKGNYRRDYKIKLTPDNLEASKIKLAEDQIIKTQQRVQDISDRIAKQIKIDNKKRIDDLMMTNKEAVKIKSTLWELGTRREVTFNGWTTACGRDLAYERITLPANHIQHDALTKKLAEIRKSYS